MKRARWVTCEMCKGRPWADPSVLACVGCGGRGRVIRPEILERRARMRRYKLSKTY